MNSSITVDSDSPARNVVQDAGCLPATRPGTHGIHPTTHRRVRESHDAPPAGPALPAAKGSDMLWEGGRLGCPRFGTTSRGLLSCDQYILKSIHSQELSKESPSRCPPNGAAAYLRPEASLLAARLSGQTAGWAARSADQTAVKAAALLSRHASRRLNGPNEPRSFSIQSVSAPFVC
jgi:hypothetical protein